MIRFNMTSLAYVYIYCNAKNVKSFNLNVLIAVNIRKSKLSLIVFNLFISLDYVKVVKSLVKSDFHF